MTGEIWTTEVKPSATGTAITPETDKSRYHLVMEPAQDRRRHLVVMLPGSNAAVSGYSDFIAHAARLGFAAIGLGYPNRGSIGSCCQSTDPVDRCFAQARGSIVFGARVLAPNGDTYDSDHMRVDASNSIVNRLISLIDYLAVGDAFWGRFLIGDSSSPYVTATRGPVRLDAEKMIFAGHSQGGGHAVFLAMHTLIERVVMLSGPDDTTLIGTAPWVGGRSATPLDRYWGLRHDSEGRFGEHIAQVWSEIGGVGVGGGVATSEVEVGDGSGDPKGAHRLVLSGDMGAPLANHMSTAYNGAYPAGAPDAWTYLLGVRDQSTNA